MKRNTLPSIQRPAGWSYMWTTETIRT